MRLINHLIVKIAAKLQKKSRPVNTRFLFLTDAEKEKKKSRNLLEKKNKEENNIKEEKEKTLW